MLRQPVEMIDILPSILDLGGLAGDARPSGQSLAGALLGQGNAPPRPVYLFRRHYDGSQLGLLWVEGVQLGVRDGPWKYILAPEQDTAELFNLEEDPGETENVVGARPEVASRLAGLLDARMTESEWESGARQSVV